MLLGDNVSFQFVLQSFDEAVQEVGAQARREL